MPARSGWREKEDYMNAIHRYLTAVLAPACLALTLAPAATPCGYQPQPGASYTIVQPTPNPHDPLESASSEAAIRDLSRATAGSGLPSIVGMWNVQFISKGNLLHNPSIPDGAVIDFGYVQWHSDATEFFNSGDRAPSTQNYCMGVWTSTGAYTYQLNHFAIQYDTSGNYTGKANIAETVALSPGGTRYTGTFTITIFDTKGNQTDQIFGLTTATRITVDTTTP
jgi:hypothetical protein